jgi:hypothetical protein
MYRLDNVHTQTRKPGARLRAKVPICFILTSLFCLCRWSRWPPSWTALQTALPPEAGRCATTTCPWIRCEANECMWIRCAAITCPWIRFKGKVAFVYTSHLHACWCVTIKGQKGRGAKEREHTWQTLLAQAAC